MHASSSVSAFLVMLVSSAYARNEIRSRLIRTFTIRGEINKDPLSSTKAKSSMNCVHFCVQDKTCGTAVFKPLHLRQILSGACLLYDSLTEKDISKNENLAAENKAYIIRAPRNCQDALAMSPRSGVYDLIGLGKHYCKAGMMNCGGQGWTLALKINGDKDTFNYDSLYWTNTLTYNEEKCLANITSNEEGKFKAFAFLPFKKICLEMRDGEEVRRIELKISKDSRYQLFQGGEFMETRAGRDAWKALIHDSSLQLNCNKEGVNLKSPYISVRLGYQANNENHCDNNDSVLGIGVTYTIPTYTCAISSGNCATGSGDNGEKLTSTVSFLYIS